MPISHPGTDAFREPLTRGGAYFRTKQLVFPTPDRAVLRRTRAVRLWWLVLLAVGGGLVWVCRDQYQAGVHQGAWFAGIAAGVALLVGTLGLLGCLGLQSVVADRLRKEVILHRGRWPLGRSTVLRMSDIRAIQICSRYSPGDAEMAAATFFELNLVLRNPPAKRICLFCHTEEQAARRDAAGLAEFLNVTLLDCTEPTPADGS